MEALRGSVTASRGQYPFRSSWQSARRHDAQVEHVQDDDNLRDHEEFQSLSSVSQGHQSVNRISTSTTRFPPPCIRREWHAR